MCVGDLIFLYEIYKYITEEKKKKFRENRSKNVAVTSCAGSREILRLENKQYRRQLIADK